MQRPRIVCYFALVCILAITPLASSSGLRFTVPDSTLVDIMVALLMPPSQMKSLVWGAGCLDFGATMLHILQAMSETEYGCALGMYDGSLEMELVHATEAHGTASNMPPL